jgi:xanthine dehydrogenase accessory factor
MHWDPVWGNVVVARWFCILSGWAHRTLSACARLWRDSLTPVALFGGGHVGRALVDVLQTLPMQVTWVDSRDNIFPPGLGGQVCCEQSEPVQAAVDGLASGSRVVIMSFSHAEDLDVVVACLERQRAHRDLPYIGLIGSKTKWAAFRQRLRARGFTDA